jgi:hypothetical protein
MTIAIVALVISVLGCCLPLGIVPLVFAMQVGKKEAAGDLAGAQNSAKMAKTMSIVAIIVSIITGICFWVLGGIGVLLSLAGSH